MDGPVVLEKSPGAFSAGRKEPPTGTIPRSLRRLGAVLRLQLRVAASMLRRREQGFAGIESVHRLPQGPVLLPEEEVARWTFAWMGTLSRLGWRAACLRRSLVLAEVLRREGHDARVVLGAGRRGDVICGHCWVEVGGRELGGGSGGHVALWRSEDPASGR